MNNQNQQTSSHLPQQKVNLKNEDSNESDQLRADIYFLLAALLRKEPNQALLYFLQHIDIENELNNDITKAWCALKHASQQLTTDQLEDEFFTVFIGVGCGEVIPYSSWFICGALMDKPLALLRQDIAKLGFERQDNVKEPEDHIAALFEVMGSLILDAPAYRQFAFFHQHIENWFLLFCDALLKAPSANFYKAVAMLAKAFFDIEANTFAQIALTIAIDNPSCKRNILTDDNR